MVGGDWLACLLESEKVNIGFCDMLSQRVSLGNGNNLIFSGFSKSEV